MPATVELVVAPTPTAPALERAKHLGIATLFLDPKSVDFSEQLLEALANHGIEWICLAGYLRLLPHALLEAFPKRVLNIHPALLPKYGGKGMYGKNVHKAVIAAGETVSGCSIHFVEAEYDSGACILQLTCAVQPDDTPETLAARVLELEHRAYPEAVALALSHDNQASTRKA